uniref:Homeobox domain-containing protein n=1 Tax=Steinernema glaseri TaxID=37863 RepID=A0A1I7XZT7_9BILA
MGDVKPDAYDLSYLAHLVQTLCAEQVDPHDEYNYQYIMAKSNELLAHRMSGALFAALCDKKLEIANSRPPPTLRQGAEEREIARLDNMLVAEGVIAKPEHEALYPPGDAAEYKSRLETIRSVYETEMRDYEKQNRNFKATLTQLLEQHKRVRPISEEDQARTMQLVDQKTLQIAAHIKQWACEAVMSLKGRLCDARRKRRNFSKPSVDILNQYFFANLENPYPSEEVKEELARMCNMSTNQVSNWFGNKRIRYKKALAKKKVQDSSQFLPHPPPSGAVPFNFYSAAMMPYGMPGMPPQLG